MILKERERTLDRIVLIQKSREKSGVSTTKKRKTSSEPDLSKMVKGLGDVELRFLKRLIEEKQTKVKKEKENEC